MKDKELERQRHEQRMPREATPEQQRLQTASRLREQPPEQIAGAVTLYGMLTGVLLGILIGSFAGAKFGQGEWNIANLAPLASGGVGIASFLFAAFFASLLGLIGAMIGTAIEAKPETQKQMSGLSGFLLRLPIFGSILLALIMAYTLYLIASRGIGSGHMSDQTNRVTWNQKNVTRIGGGRDVDPIRHIQEIAFPSTSPANSPSVVVRVPEDWRTALAATSLIARPTRAQITTDERRQSDVALQEGDPATAAATIDQRFGETGTIARNVIIVNSESDYRWALPAGPYAARTGTPILFVNKQQIPESTRSALAKRNNQANIFVLGPSSVVSNAMLDELEQYGRVTRIEGSDPVEQAVRFAEFRDDEANFGWGQTGEAPRQWSSFHAILVNPARWQEAVFAAHLARGAKAGPLLFVHGNTLPAVVDNYLWRQRPIFAITPAEGSFNHLWVVGGFSEIPYAAQAWADFSQEIEQYMTLGDSAVSGFEALGIAWIMLSIASAILIFYHSRKRMPMVMPMMKAAWVIFALLFGPIAVYLYYRSYNGHTAVEMEGMMMWKRPFWDRVFSATVMMFSFDMMLMVLAVFLIGLFGFPIIMNQSPVYWLGSSMFLMMVLMYIAALIGMMLLFHTPMTMHEKKVHSYWKAFAVGFPMMFATMTVESLGMMPTMWWAQMYFLPGMQMPTEDDMTMWATLLMAVGVGFLVVLPFNYIMVKRGKKSGQM